MPEVCLDWPDFYFGRHDPPVDQTIIRPFSLRVRIGWIGRWMKSELIWKKYEILPKGEKPDKTLLNSEASVDKAN